MNLVGPIAAELQCRPAKHLTKLRKRLKREQLTKIDDAPGKRFPIQPITFFVFYFCMTTAGD